MSTDNSRKKAKAWFAVLIIFAVTITATVKTIQILESQGIAVYSALPQSVVLGLFLLICALFYFLPLLRVHHYAKKAAIKWLTVLSKVLIIHFYCVLGISIVFIIVLCFSLGS